MLARFLALLQTLSALAYSQQQYSIWTAAGGDPVRDNGPAVSAFLENIAAIAFDSAGNLYIADSVTNRVRKVVPSRDEAFPELRYVRGTITTIAGTGAPYYAGDGGLAVEAYLSRPNGVAVDPEGNVYIADSGNRRIRRVGADGMIFTIAGEESPLGVLQGLAFDGENRLNFLEIATSTGLGVLKRITAEGTIEMVPGTGALRNPILVAFAPDQTIYIIETGTNSIRKVTPNGESSTFEAGFVAPRSLTFDAEGTMFVGDGGTRQIFRVDSDGSKTAILPPLGPPQVLAFDPDGNLAVAFTQQINLWVPGQTAFGAPVVGEQSRSGRNGILATDSLIYRPVGPATDAAGNLYVGAAEVSGIRVVGTDGIIQVYRPGNAVALPAGILVDREGNKWFSDVGNHRVVRVAADGTFQVIAGVGRPMDTGDGGPAIEAALVAPSAMAIDLNGNLYVLTNNRVRRINAADGTINAFASGPVNAIATDVSGNVFVSDLRQIRKFSPDGTVIGTLNFGANGLAVDAAGNLIFTNGHALYRMTPDGERSVIAGSEVPGYTGDGGDAQFAQFNNPGTVWIDATGTIYVNDRANHRIRKLLPLVTAE
jgi:sugar lactone lactonase YvrE